MLLLHYSETALCKGDGGGERRWLTSKSSGRVVEGGEKVDIGQLQCCKGNKYKETGWKI